MTELTVHKSRTGWYTDSEVSADQEEIAMIEDEIHKCKVNILSESIRIGELLIEARKILPHGDFQPWMERVLTSQRGSECMWLAEGYKDQQSDVYNFLHDAGIESKTKALAVRSMPKDVLADTMMYGRLGDTPIKEVGSLSVRELKEQIKKARKLAAPTRQPAASLESALSSPSEAENILSGLLIELGRAARDLSEHPPLSMDLANRYIHQINQASVSIINSIRPHSEVEVEPFGGEHEQ